MKLPPVLVEKVVATDSAEKAERDRSFLIFAGIVLVAIALGFKSELLSPGQVWALALGMVVIAAPALLGYLRGTDELPRVVPQLSGQRVGDRASARIHLCALRRTGGYVPGLGDHGAAALPHRVRRDVCGHAAFRLVHQPGPGPAHRGRQLHEKRGPRVRRVRDRADLPVRRQLPAG